jgi:phospho-N-acetylmuramoyl-pentapeptide-transferase
MLYHLLYPLASEYGLFNVVRYITFRTAAATLTALFLSFIVGPPLIRALARLRVRQPIREIGPDHQSKAGTPTIRKVTSQRNEGISVRAKLGWQFLLALVVAIAIYNQPTFDKQLAVPFFKEFTPHLGLFYIPLAILVIMGTSNAVNLTDGLDGLAIGPVMIAAGVFLGLSYAAGHAGIAEYLAIKDVPGSGQLAIFCGALVGGGLGFLWFNTYPAQLFMGDVGSLALGGALGTIAVVIRQEILLAVVGGVFVVETLSVMIQVASFKLTGKRVFLMAPLHHHYEQLGWPEQKIVVRFWIVSIILGLIALSSLKLR